MSCETGASFTGVTVKLKVWPAIVAVPSPTEKPNKAVVVSLPSCV